jgi:acetyl esterase/lipase
VGVLVIHGGAWMMGEKEQLVMWATGLAAKGYVCVLNGYRLASAAGGRKAIKC